MSNVTNVILLFHESEDEKKRLLEVNSFICNIHTGRVLDLISIEASHLPHHWYGGVHDFIGHMYVGAYNHLDHEALRNHLSNQVNWNNPEGVVLLLKFQDNDHPDLYFNAGRDHVYDFRAFYEEIIKPTIDFSEKTESGWFDWE